MVKNKQPKMKVLVDCHIPFIKGLLENFLDVEYLEPEEFVPRRVADADALVIRTRTRCNAALLDNSRVQFIATATIGLDHIDTDYCRSHNIFFTNAPGCNAQGVCDYVEDAIKEVVGKKKEVEGLILGVVGVGHVGSLVAKMGTRLGMKVLLNDPPKSKYSNCGIYTDLNTLAEQADIITFHTPLTKDGDYPTWHLCDSDLLAHCRKNVVIINAARGGILDEEAALAKQHSDKTFVIDTWEGEPHISQRMLDRAAIATPHIAGYTLQGKINATDMCLQAICKYFGLPALSIQRKTLPLQPLLKEDWILDDDRSLRASPEKFEYLRENYKLR